MTTVRPITKNNFKTLIIASIGSMFECYDFMACVFLAPYLIKIFFAGNSGLGIFTIFTVAFFTRPLGGIFWSHLGDKYGRKLVFSLSMAAMVIPTLAIAFFPTKISPTLNCGGFILLRALQGFLVGGEFSGGVTFIAEIAPKSRRGLWVALFMALLSIGTLLASAINLILGHYLNPQEIALWGWRIPFAISIVLIVITIYIRSLVQETAVFTEMRIRKEIVQIPLIRLLDQHLLSVITGILITTCSATGLTTLYTFLPQIFKSVKYLQGAQTLNLTTVGLITLCLLMPAFGYLSDKVGRKRVFMFGMYGTSLMLTLFVIALKYQNRDLLYYAMLLASTTFAAVNAIYCIALSELFPTNIRFSGIALCYTMGYSLCGGLLPILYLKFLPITITFILPLIIYASLSLLLASLIWRRHKNCHGRELLP